MGKLTSSEEFTVDTTEDKHTLGGEFPFPELLGTKTQPDCSTSTAHKAFLKYEQRRRLFLLSVFSPNVSSTLHSHLDLLCQYMVSGSPQLVFVCAGLCLPGAEANTTTSCSIAFRVLQ